MLGRLLRRLFRRETRGAVTPVATAAVHTTVTAELPPPAASIDRQATPATTTSAPSNQPAFDGEMLWRERLEGLSAHQRHEATLADNPDAAALLQLLAEGPDAVIRQLPSAARDALALCDDHTLSRAQLASRLSADPALVQGLLRTANSASMASGRAAVLGIDQALDRIGLSGARAVVLASCVDGLLSHPGGEYNAMAADVWSHMVRTAPIARAVAAAFAADADEAFSVALLHDVGKLVIFDRLSTLRAARRRNIALPMPFVHRVLQELHEPLGALAALRWGMGDRAAAAIGTHHRNATAPLRDSLAETIYVAEHADHAMRKAIPLDLDTLWASGRLTGSPVRVANALQSLLAAA